MSKNDITGDILKTKIGDKESQDKYSEGYDRIFGKKNKKSEREDNQDKSVEECKNE